MGRIGETIARTWQVAAHMKAERGSLPEDAGSGNDNARIKRYVAKYTLNAARIYGIDHEIGSLEPGKLADIVLWEPKFFGIKPEVVFKGGFPAWSVMGESNASLMTCEPLTYRPQWGAFGGARQALSVTFMAQAAIDARRARAARAAIAAASRRAARRALTKRDLVWNDALPEIRVDPETYRVEVDGELCTCEPMARVPLGPLYVLKNERGPDRHRRPGRLRQDPPGRAAAAAARTPTASRAAVITNDLVTKEDAERLQAGGLIAPELVVGVETGACPHTAIREDPVDEHRRRRAARARARPARRRARSSPAATTSPPRSRPTSSTTGST